MIHCLLIKISTNSRNLPVRSYHTLMAEEITFGRGAECTIHLADPRISMHHAVIKRMDDGQLHLNTIHGDLNIDNGTQQSIKLDQGQQIMIGPYRLSIEPSPPDVNLTVSLELAHHLPDDYQDLKSRTHDPLPNAAHFKRKLAIWMAVLIATIFIGLPLAQNLIPQLRNVMSELPFGFDRVWSPGHFSNAHLHFSAQCSNCHQVPTLRISDHACLKCHTDTAPHIADKSLQKRAFKTSKLSNSGMRCAECHKEHKAPHALARQDNLSCVKCHGNIKFVNPATTLTNIHDFDKDHPAFRLSLKSEHSKTGIERIPQTEKSKLIEKSGLKFPHSQHVGLVQGPGGINDIRNISCVDCHRADGKEMIFKPISFKNDCISCHANQLKFGSGANRINIPHGEEINVANALIVQAPKQFSEYSEKLKNNGCGYCHVVTDIKKEELEQTKIKGTLSWKVVPPDINQDWFTKAHFNHALHRTQQCQSCHDVEKSESSEDIAMPDRNSCLKCHSGDNPKHKRITSGCMSCHDFHSAHAPASTENNNHVTD